MADFDEVAALLHIHEKASAHGEAFKNIKDAAWAKLKQIDQEHADAKNEPAEESEPEAEETEDAA